LGHLLRPELSRRVLVRLSVFVTVAIWLFYTSDPEHGDRSLLELGSD